MYTWFANTQCDFDGNLNIKELPKNYAHVIIRTVSVPVL
jgi:hypothetical protein